MKKIIVLALAALAFPALFAATETVFETDFSEFADGLPKGWKKYEQGKAGAIRQATLENGKKAAELIVTDSKASLGLTRQFPVKGDVYYRALLETAPLPGKSRKGAYLQLRFYPYPLKTFGNSDYLRQVPLADYDDGSTVTAVDLKAPAGSTGVTAFIVTAGGAPEIRLTNFKLESSDIPFPPVKADPMRIPGVLEIESRNLHLATDLVRDGKAAAAIVAPAAAPYPELAAAVADAVEAKTGVRLPVLADDAGAGGKLPANLITIGGRDVNLTVSNLYNRFYTIIDGKYPGQGGYVVRSIHNPLGDGRNVVTAGGSDLAGDRLAVEKLTTLIAKLPPGKSLRFDGYLVELKLGDGQIPPENAKEALVWDDFGWTLVSKNLALFYQTNDPKYAGEFLRLAFPDEEVAKELNRDEKNEFAYSDLRNPLGNPYHYCSTMYILYWDLVEEHPFFSEADRLRVTKKFYEQLNTRRTNGDKGIYKLFQLKETPAKLSDRHWISEALTVYVAGRYFDKYYPSRDGRDALATSRRMFRTLDQYPAINAGSVYWYNSFLRPAFDFALLDGGLKYVGSPVIGKYVEALMLLSDRTPDDWSQVFSDAGFLSYCAYLTGNQAPVELLKLKTGFDTGKFRLGRSFWAVKPFERNYFSDTDGAWRAAQFDARGMDEWNPPFDKTRVVEWMSYRRQGAEGNDFALLDAKFESGRNPFHNFALISFYLRGTPLLRGYHNQLTLYRDGLGDAEVAKYTEVLQSGRTGKTAFLRGKVAKFNGHDWVRTLLIRENGFLLELDEVTQLTDAKTPQILSDFETPQETRAAVAAPTSEFTVTPPRGGPWTIGCSLPAELEQQKVPGGASLRASGLASRFSILVPGRKGGTVRFASILRPGAPDARPSAAQSGNLIALQLPEPALLELLPGGAFLLDEPFHRFGFNVREMPGVFTADSPVAADFDLMAGKLTLTADRPAKVTLTGGRMLTLAPGEPAAVEVKGAARPGLAEQVAAILAAKPAVGNAAKSESPVLPEVARQKVGEFVGVKQALEIDGESLLAAAVDDKVLLLDKDGKIRQTFKTSGQVGAICYWPERKILLAGSVDEKLRAFALDGRQLWEFTSRMPDGVKHERMWWAKGALPGVSGIAVAELAPGRPLIFVGGAGTLEILDADGKLLKRHFQEWGRFEEFTLLPAHGKEPASMLSWGYMVGHPAVYRYKENLQRGYLDLSSAKDGSFMGGFGFGYVGRNALRVTRLEPGGPERLAGTFNGTFNRVMVWDLEGQVLHEADLGVGIRAFSGNYAQYMFRGSNIRGFELPDFDGNGQKSIAVGVNRKFVTAFDAKLQSRFFHPLPADPLTLAVIPGPSGDRLAVGCVDGTVAVIDGKGEITAKAQIEGQITLLQAIGDRLLAGTDHGEIVVFGI